MTFVFFIYGDIQWGSGANIGFGAGDGTRSFMNPGALTNQVLNIDEGSNVNMKGVYIYRVDLCSVLGPKDGEKPKLLLVVLTAINICWANYKSYLSSQISQNDGYVSVTNPFAMPFTLPDICFISMYWYKSSKSISINVLLILKCIVSTNYGCTLQTAY